MSGGVAIGYGADAIGTATAIGASASVEPHVVTVIGQQPDGSIGQPTVRVVPEAVGEQPDPVWRQQNAGDDEDRAAWTRLRERLGIGWSLVGRHARALCQARP